MSNLLEKASIVTTPTAYDNGKILSVKPNTSVGDFDFTRNSSATRVNSQGLIEDITSNLPRIDYTGGEGHWLFEPQSTNEISYSEDFSDAYWSKLGSPTVTLNYGVSPSGQNNSVRIQGNSSTVIYNNGGFSATDGRSIYVKATSGSGSIQLLTAASNTDNVFSIDENWKRIEINAAAVAASTFYAVDMRGASTDIFDIEIWGAQIENLSYATSYIPTNGSTVTRLQDAAFGSGSSDLINSTEGVLYFEGSALTNETDVNKTIGISNVSSSNRVQLTLHGTPSRISFYGTSSEGFALSYSNFSYNKTEPLKIAVKWKIGDVGIFINGIKVYTGTPANTFLSNTLNTLSFADYNNVGSPFYGKTKCLAVFKEALTDEELTCLTTI